MMICLFSPSESEGGMFETTVMPSRICQNHLINALRGWTMLGKRTRHATLGIARITVVLGRTQLVSCAMVTPERMLMSSFPTSASLIPSSFRMGCANCGLQLNTIRKRGYG